MLVVRNNKLGIIQRLVAVADSSATSAVHLPISSAVLFFLLLMLKLHKLTHMQMLEDDHLLKSNMFMILIVVVEAQAPCIIPRHRMRRDALYSAVTQCFSNIERLYVVDTSSGTGQHGEPFASPGGRKISSLH